MVTWQEIRHQAAIAGRLTDGQTGRPIGGATIRITSGPPEFDNLLALLAVQHGDRWPRLALRLDRTRTAADGHFHFLDLPDGQYTLEVSIPGPGSRYGTTQSTVQVSRNPDTSINLAAVNPVVQPTTVSGLVTNQVGDPIIMAAVQIQGSGERAFTDAQGDYRLVGVETGSRTITASAQGLQPVTRTVLLTQAGDEQNLDFTLSAPLASPLAIAGCNLWLRADAITGLREGDSISSWPDGSGQGSHAVQTTPSDQPAFGPNALSSHAAVQINGTDHYLELPLANPLTDHTFIFVYSFTPSGTSSHFLMDVELGRLSLDAASPGTPSSIRWNDGNWKEVGFAIPGPQVLTWLFSGTTGEVFRNGSSVGSATYDPTPLAGRVALGASDNGTSSYFAGIISEVLYYHRALTAAERQQIEQHLSHRYSIPLA
jgi:hypothetical protein